MNKFVLASHGILREINQMIRRFFTRLRYKLFGMNELEVLALKYVYEHPGCSEKELIEYLNKEYKKC